MTECTATFETGVDGSDISTGDAGSATAWTSITAPGSSATLKYDNDHVSHGSLAALFHTAGASGNAGTLTWGAAALGTLTDHYGRVYLYLTANPGGAINWLLFTSTGAMKAALRIETDGKFSVVSQAFSGIPVTSTGSIALNQWIRFEYHLNHSTGAVEVKLFNTASSTTATETINSTVGGQFGASINEAGYNTGTTNFNMWVDDIVAGATSYPGPAAAAAQTLLASADSVDGSWTNEAGGTTLAASIDETTASDTDYIQSELSPSASGCRVKLAAGGDPASSSGHEINWRAGKNATGGQTVNMTVKLYQGGGNSLGGGTLIADFDRNAVDAMTDYTETLSGGEADAITDYTDLYLEFHATV